MTSSRETVKPGINLLVSPEEDDPGSRRGQDQAAEAAVRGPRRRNSLAAPRSASTISTIGYALTVHKAQGSQWNNVVLFDESYAFKDTRQRWLYTAITRAAETLTVVR